MNQIKESCIDIAREILMSEYWIIRNDLFVQYDQTDKASTEYPEEPPFPTIDDIILFSKRIETYVLDSLVCTTWRGNYDAYVVELKL